MNPREARARVEIDTKSREAVPARSPGRRRSEGRADKARADKLAEAVPTRADARAHRTYKATAETTLGDVLEGRLTEVKPEEASPPADDHPESEIPVETKAEPAESKEATR